MELELNERFGLIGGSKLKNVRFDSGNKGLDDWLWRNHLDEDSRRTAEDWIYFYFKKSGYISRSFSSQATDSLEAEIRSFLGCSIATQKMFSYEEYVASYRTFVVLYTLDGQHLRPAGSLSTDIYQALHFALSPELLVKFRSQARLASAFDPVASALKQKSDRKLQTAATRIYRAASRGTTLDRVLETTIALEVLLGDRAMSDKVGLTRLMSNRCAYALARSESERSEILTNFEKFYALRSQIVHTGRLSLSVEQEVLVDWAIDISWRMFRYETNVLVSQ